MEARLEEGRPYFFEILVDNMKAISKTSDLNAFDKLERFVDEDSREVVVLLYPSEKSPYNEKRIFKVWDNAEPEPEKQEPVQQGLSGVEVKKIVEEQVQIATDRIESKHAKESLTEKLEAAKKDLEEAKEYIQTLQAELEKAKVAAPTIKGADIGEFLTGAVIGVVKENPKLAKKIPPGLAGLFNLEKKDKEEPEDEEEEEPSYRKVTPSEEQPAPEISEEEKKSIALARQLVKAFPEAPLKKVYGILNSFIKDPALIDTVDSLLTKEQKEDKK